MIASVATAQLKAGSELKPVTCCYPAEPRQSWEKWPYINWQLDFNHDPSQLVEAMGSTTPPSQPTLLLPQATPIRADTSTTLSFTTNQKYHIKSCTAMAEKMKRYLVGLMPVQQFIDDFFPLSKIGRLARSRFKPGCYSKTVEVATEMQVYTPFVSPILKNHPLLSDNFHCF